MSIFRSGNKSIINPTIPQYYVRPAKVVKTHKSYFKNDPGALFVENLIFQCIYPLFGPKICNFRTGYESIIKPTVPQYYIYSAEVVKTHKSSIKNDTGALFVEKSNISVYLPPYLGLKCAFLEPEISQ